jgi:nitrogen fixation/metabolism regulation signal transduction histidine kinase
MNPMKHPANNPKKQEKIDLKIDPKKNPVSKSVTFSSIALIIAIILIDVPMCFHTSSDALYYFLIGVLFNAARFLFLGFVIGCIYKRLYGKV